VSATPESPQGESERARDSRLVISPNAMAYGALVCGVAFRMTQYAFRTSIWHDEAFIALNIIHKSYAGLLGPLDWNETAPPGFTFLEKTVYILLGSSEYSWRLIPLLAGLTGLLAFSALARVVCGSGYARAWAVVMMAASDKLISQANELKHFTLDLLLSVLILSLAIRALYSSAPARLVVILGFTGAIGIWFSFSSGFVFAGAGLALLAPALLHWKRPAQLALAFAGTIGLVSFLMLSPTLRAQGGTGLIQFWKDSFPDPTHPIRMAIWLVRAVVGLFNYFWQPFGLVLALLAVLGSTRMSRSASYPVVAVLWLSILFSLVAAFVHRWPFGGNQHMVFAAPAVFLSVGVGIEAVRELIARPLYSWLLLGVLLVPQSALAAYHLVVPRYRHEARPVIEFYEAQRRPDDGVVVQCVAEFEFYATNRDLPAIRTPDPARRLWIITTSSGAKGFDPEAIAKLAPHRPYLGGEQAYGAGAYLFGPEIPSSR